MQQERAFGRLFLGGVFWRAGVNESFSLVKVKEKERRGGLGVPTRQAGGRDDVYDFVIRDFINPMVMDRFNVFCCVDLKKKIYLVYGLFLGTVFLLLCFTPSFLCSVCLFSFISR